MLISIFYEQATVFYGIDSDQGSITAKPQLDLKCCAAGANEIQNIRICLRNPKICKDLCFRRGGGRGFFRSLQTLLFVEDGKVSV